MLTHSVLPQRDSYLVVYPTPGCDVPTVATICRTFEAAQAEADRLNAAQGEQGEQEDEQ